MAADRLVRNIKLLTQVREKISRQRELFKMSYWGVGTSGREWWPTTSGGEVDHIQLGKGANECGTPACICGWAIRFAQNPHRGRIFNGVLQEDEGGELLGLTPAEAQTLFFMYNWPMWAKRLGEHAGAVALLTNLIEGRKLKAKPDKDRDAVE